MQLEKLFRFRNIWLGAAMLWVMLFHSEMSLNFSALNYLKYFGYGGVDICLFASGIGCYYSLEKNPDLLAFLQRRISRLGPVYLCFIVPWLIWKLVFSQFPPEAVLGNLLGIQSLVSWDYHFNWYIGGLVVFYLCLPYFKAITDACSSLWKDLAVTLLLIVISIPFWKAPGDNLILLSRLPVLYLGVVCAKMAKTGHKLQITHWILLLCCMAAGLVFLWWGIGTIPEEMGTYGLFWYPFILIAPGCCLSLSAAANWMDRVPVLCWMNKLLATVGIYSFEVYLVHIFVFEEFMPGIIGYFDSVPNNLLWILTLPVIAGGSFLLNRAARCLTAFTKRIKKA